MIIAGTLGTPGPLLKTVPEYQPRIILVNLPVSELLLESLGGPKIAKELNLN